MNSPALTASPVRRPSFDKSLSFGQQGENSISLWLINTLKYSVLPVYETEGRDFKGPRCFTPGRQIIAPDILAMKEGKVLWIEAKHKTVFSWHRISRQWTTGIDVHHYQNYLELAEKHPFPVWLLFLHEQSVTSEGCGECPTGLFGGSLQYLSAHENHRSDRHGKSGMVYWAHGTLSKMADVRRSSRGELLIESRHAS